MSVDREREFWEGKAAHSEVAAIEAIGADPSMWDGVQLESDLERILRAFKHVDMRNAAPNVLDLGCGIGRVAIPLAERLNRALGRWSVVGVDISDSMLARAEARARQRERALGYMLEVYFVSCDGRSIWPLQPGDRGLNPRFVDKFALVYSILTLQHIPREAVVSYIEQVGVALSLGGVFLFQALEGTGDSFLWHEFDEVFVRSTCTAAGLDVIEIERVKVNTGDTATSIWVTAVKK